MHCCQETPSGPLLMLELSCLGMHAVRGYAGMRLLGMATDGVTCQPMPLIRLRTIRCNIQKYSATHCILNAVFAPDNSMYPYLSFRSMCGCHSGRLG